MSFETPWSKQETTDFENSIAELRKMEEHRALLWQHKEELGTKIGK